MKLPDWNDPEALMAFWREVNRAPIRTARALFPARHKGYVADTRCLASAAANRTAALRCRQRDDETAAACCYDVAVRSSLHALTALGYVFVREAKWAR